MTQMAIMSDAGIDSRTAFLSDEAHAHGFDAFGTCRADDPRLLEAGERLRAFVAGELHGEMGWMAETLDRRAAPQQLWPQARSAAMFAMNYGPQTDPLAVLGRKDRGAISVYAQNRDYHDVLKGRLKQIAGRFAARFNAQVKVFVDTAPVMEKPLAALAGIGWQGKHTNLVSRAHGSWLFLGALFTNVELAASEPETDRCGSCRRCLDICPTDAFLSPYRLDARRCISYLTIELKGQIPHQFRTAIGNRIYGCDDCLAVCPWNKFASQASEAKLRAPQGRDDPRLAGLLGLDDAAFRAMFAGSPVKRTGRERFLRNCLIAAGNSGDVELLAPVRKLLGDASPLVRGAAVWALSRLVDRAAFAHERDARLPAETDAHVREEWAVASGSPGADRTPMPGRKE